MKRIIFFTICLSFLLIACKKLPDPSQEILESYSFSSQGSGQKALSGNYLPDTIGVMITSNMSNSYDMTGMKVKFEVLTGEGSVDDTIITTGAYGYAFTRWKLGSQQFTQTVQASIYDKAGKFLATIHFTGYGFIDNSWNQVSYYPDIGISSMVSDTIHHFTYMISGMTLYKQKTNYFEWEPVNLSFQNPSKIWLCKDGTLFILSSGNGLFKSNDQGKSWDQCDSIFPVKNPQVVVTADKYIWATWGNSGLHCSRDGGASWTVDSVGIPPDAELGDICHMSNGTWLFLAQNKHTYKSVDDGKTWSQVYCPPLSLKLFVTADDEIIYCCQENAIALYKSTDMGLSFQQIYVVQVYFVSSMGQTFFRYNNTWYILIQGYGILKTNDFTNFETTWYHSLAWDLFIDQNGVFIVSELTGQSVFYNKGLSK